MLALCFAEDSQGKVLSGADLVCEVTNPAKIDLKSAICNDVGG
jgi:hypothetical protein